MKYCSTQPLTENLIAVKDILPQATTSRTATCDEGTLCRVRVLGWGAGEVGRGNMHAGALAIIRISDQKYQIPSFQYDKEGGVGEFLWTHTTASMGIGKFS